MKKIIKFIILTAFTTFVGIFFGALLFKYFLYSQIIFLIIHLSLVVLLIFGIAKAINTLEKGHGLFKTMSDFGFGMSEPFHSVVRQFNLNSILIAGVIFGFIGCIGYLETRDAGYFAFFVLFPLSYMRALLSYQKFKEFR